ncbi:MAG: TonB family protein [Proteobacteria bacterium]|nr:TonB family protein [Pseudomonadota bacterium]
MSFARTEPAWPALVVAGALSLAAHAAVLAGFAGRGETLMIEGGGVAEIAALGNDFRDFTRGALPSQAAEAVPETPTEASMTPPPTEAAPTPPPAAPPVTATDAPATRPETAEAPAPPPRAAPETPTETAPQAAPAASETPTVNAAPATAPVASAPAAAPITPQATPLAAAAPVTPPTTAPAPEVEVRTAAADTPRPQRRPDPETQRRPEPETRRPPQQASAAQAAGDSDRDARRGSDQGQPEATAARAAPRQAAAAAPGNAAASNYPGQVMQRIQRVRRARVNARGTAVVAFTIAAGGGLAGVQIVRASGSAVLDQAALDHIRRAAPFPAPPEGAQRQFSFEFVGR